MILSFADFAALAGKGDFAAALGEVIEGSRTVVDDDNDPMEIADIVGRLLNECESSSRFVISAAVDRRIGEILQRVRDAADASDVSGLFLALDTAEAGVVGGDIALLASDVALRLLQSEATPSATRAKAFLALAALDRGAIGGADTWVKLARGIEADVMATHILRLLNWHPDEAKAVLLEYLRGSSEVRAAALRDISLLKLQIKATIGRRALDELMEAGQNAPSAHAAGENSTNQVVAVDQIGEPSMGPRLRHFVKLIASSSMASRLREYFLRPAADLLRDHGIEIDINTTGGSPSVLSVLGGSETIVIASDAASHSKLFYELGVAHAAGREIVILDFSAHSPPFSVSNQGWLTLDRALLSPKADRRLLEKAVSMLASAIERVSQYRPNTSAEVAHGDHWHFEDHAADRHGDRKRRKEIFGRKIRVVSRASEVVRLSLARLDDWREAFLQPVRAGRAIPRSIDHRPLILIGHVGGADRLLREEIREAIEDNFPHYSFDSTVRVAFVPWRLPMRHASAGEHESREVAASATRVLKQASADAIVWGRRTLAGEFDLRVIAHAPNDQLRHVQGFQLVWPRGRPSEAVQRAFAFAIARNARPILDRPQDYKPERLQPIVEALESVVETLSPDISDNLLLDALSAFASGALSLGERGGDVKWLRKALDAKSRFLDNIDQRDDRAAWGRAQQEIGRALTALGEREGSQDILLEAASRLRLALDALRSEDSLPQAEVALRALQRAEQNLARRKRVNLRWPGPGEP